jgi:tetratricopeptide (TPR) repeat protein
MKQNRKTHNSTEPLTKEVSPVIWISFWKSKKNILFFSVILSITFIAYLPSLNNGFVNWDDPAYIYENPQIINISKWGDLLGNLGEFFTKPVVSGYTPLVTISFAFEKMFYGLDSPKWWHLNNIILHIICVLLVFRIMLALGLKLIPATFCALLFGIHPMRVESVAWVTERKDVLYGSFYLLALYYYIKSVKLSFRKRYSIIIAFSFILALLSKIQAVSLPLSMLLVDYYFGRKISIKLVYEKWLYFLLSLATGILGIYLLRTLKLLQINENLPLYIRIFFGSNSYVVYIIKSIVPYQLVPVYSLPDISDLAFYASMVPALFILGLIFCFFLKKEKMIVWGLLFFTFNIIFVLQINIGGHSYLADRYTYIPYLGLFFIYAYGLQWLVGEYGKFDKLFYLIAVFILGLFGYMNFEQNKIWKNSETLWSHVLKNNTKDYLPWYSRGLYYSKEKRFKEALHDYTKAISLYPNNPKIYNSRGNLYFDANHPDALKLALLDYTKAIQFSPKSSDFFLSRGATYASLKMFDNALKDFNAAEKLDPQNYIIYSNRFRIYLIFSQYDKAQHDLEKYLSLNSSNPEMWSNLGEVNRLKKQYENSLNAFNKAIQIDPNNLVYYSARLKTFYDMGDIERARNDLNFLKSKGFKDINPEYQKRINQGI